MVFLGVPSEWNESDSNQKTSSGSTFAENDPPSNYGQGRSDSQSVSASNTIRIQIGNF